MKPQPPQKKTKLENPPNKNTQKKKTTITKTLRKPLEKNENPTKPRKHLKNPLKTLENPTKPLENTWKILWKP